MYFDPTLAAVKHKINIATFKLISKYQVMQGHWKHVLMFSTLKNESSFLPDAPIWSWLEADQLIHAPPRFSDLQFRDVARSENLRERVVTCGPKIWLPTSLQLRPPDFIRFHHSLHQYTFIGGEYFYDHPCQDQHLYRFLDWLSSFMRLSRVSQIFLLLHFQNNMLEVQSW